MSDEFVSSQSLEQQLQENHTVLIWYCKNKTPLQRKFWEGLKTVVDEGIWFEVDGIDELCDLQDLLERVSSPKIMYHFKLEFSDCFWWQRHQV